MIKQQKSTDGGTNVTFVLTLEEAPDATSVVGDFNNWDPLATPMKKRSNGTRSASIVLQPGEESSFKYLTDGGHWFCDSEAAMRDDGNSLCAG